MSRKKGLSLVKERNKLKKESLGPLRKYAEQLEAENYALKNDPNTVVGQFIGQYRELYSQNARLSVLTAGLIKRMGDSVVITKEELEQFQTKRINIKWEIADGETVETAKEYTFSYELLEAPTPLPQEQEAVECTDPDCTLPKDLKHTHVAPTVTATEDPGSPLDNLEAGDTVVLDGEEVTVTSVEHSQ